MTNIRSRSLLVLAALALGAAAAGCGGASAPMSSPAVYASSGGGESATASAPAAPVTVGSAPSVDSTGAGGDNGGAGASSEPHPSTRPGLATEWGESRYHPMTYESFARANPSNPFATATIRYNDAHGAMAQAAYRAATAPSTYVGMYGGAVHISIRDENGNMLPGQVVGDALYVIGTHGQRYSIVIQNQSPARFEAVTTVDGLDVMNGQPGTISNPGYILRPYATLVIDGFRQNQSNVAAFRFGTVADSYAAQTGSARNVGVIGVALFAEAGAVLAPPPSSEIQLRETANPFPGQFAPPPARRYYGP
jgi:hypothetical protein